jgi:Flp pilus assembly protein TadD
VLGASDRAGLVAAAISLGAAAVVFWVAWDDGSYGVESRNVLGIAVWWAVGMLALLSPGRRGRLHGWALVVAGLLAGLALLTLASALWSPSAEKTLDEVNRVTLYLGAFLLAVLLVPRGRPRVWLDGLAIGIAAVAVVALASRLFPDLFDDRGLVTYLPSAATRLSFPLGYWNGLGIFLALGVPLLLHLAVVARPAPVRAAALTPVPVIGAAIFLTSSRGAVATALVAAAVFFALTDRRWEAGVAIASSAAGTVVAVAVLNARNELVNGPIGSGTAADQGRSAALVIALAALATGGAYVLATRGLRRVDPPRTLGIALVALVALAALAGIAAADPGRRFDEFRASPDTLAAVSEDSFVVSHLLSGSGSGRWQFWTAAVDQWRSGPLGGDGAGTYEAWWAANGSFSYFLRDAHSLYLEMLGELGPLGLLLTVGVLAVGVGLAASRARTVRGDSRVAAAALAAVLAGFAVAAGIDWMWELTAVTVLALISLALVTTAWPDETARAPVRPLIGAAVAVVALVCVAAQAIPFLAQNQLARSRSAVARGDGAAALAAARAARDIQPWAASPYLQLALVAERLGRLGAARSSIHDAIDRDSEDWRLWLIAARLETKAGAVAQARRSLVRAVELNPRSPLFRGIGGNAG